MGVHGITQIGVQNSQTIGRVSRMFYKFLRITEDGMMNENQVDVDLYVNTNQQVSAL